MVTMRIKGGLGNQMFQYAVGYVLSQKLDQPLQLDTTFYHKKVDFKYRLNKLMIENGNTADHSLNKCIDVYNNKYLNKALRMLGAEKLPLGQQDSFYILESDKWPCTVHKDIKAKKLYLNGYFQDCGFIAPFREQLMRQFVPAYKPELEYLQAKKKIQSCNSVAVHVRRGDFTGKSKHPYHYLLPKEYYQAAMQYIKDKNPDACFFCFSNDLEWSKEVFGKTERFHFISLDTQNPDIDEMMLMSKCKHIIGANSTFSWWAAWLNANQDVIRIFPQKPFGKEGLLPEDWIIM